MPGAPRVSILTVTYNHGAFIRECIESVRSQTMTDWEQVIVDDGSTDDTVAIANSINDPRVRLVEQRNKGLDCLAETYNAGLAACSAPVVAILEGDDMFPPSKLEKQVSDFDDEAVVLSSGLFQTLGVNGVVCDDSRSELPTMDELLNSPIGAASAAMLRPKFLTFAFPVATMLRRNALMRIGGFQQSPGLPLVDYPTFLRLGLEGEWRWHDEVLGIWRRHAASTTKNKLSTILEGAYAEAATFWRANRMRLPDSSLDISVEWRYFQAQRISTAAREYVALKQWSNASQLFERAAEFSPGKKLSMMFRITKALCKMRINPEFVFRAAGHPAWQSILTINNDRIVPIGASPQNFTLREFS